MSDFQEYIDLATEAGYNAADEDVLTAYHDEENKRFLVLCSDEESFWVSTYDYENEEFGEAIFESNSLVEAVDWCINYIK